MEKNNNEIIKNTRELITNGEYGLTAKINDMEVWFWGDSIEDVSDDMIGFALDIVNAYQADKEKYDTKALEEVKSCLNQDQKVDDSTIKNQLGTPIVDVATKLGASLMYESVEEIGNHMPEVIINRDLEVKSVAING